MQTDGIQLLMQTDMGHWPESLYSTFGFYSPFDQEN